MTEHSNAKPATSEITPQRHYPLIFGYLKAGCIITHQSYAFDDTDVDSTYHLDGVLLSENGALVKEIWAADDEHLLVWDEKVLGIGRGIATLIGFVQGGAA